MQTDHLASTCSIATMISSSGTSLSRLVEHALSDERYVSSSCDMITPWSGTTTSHRCHTDNSIRHRNITPVRVFAVKLSAACQRVALSFGNIRTIWEEQCSWVGEKKIGFCHDTGYHMTDISHCQKFGGVRYHRFRSAHFLFLHYSCITIFVLFCQML